MTVKWRKTYHSIDSMWLVSFWRLYAWINLLLNIHTMYLFWEL
jgi:hypothetical protein